MCGIWVNGPPKAMRIWLFLRFRSPSALLLVEGDSVNASPPSGHNITLSVCPPMRYPAKQCPISWINTVSHRDTLYIKINNKYHPMLPESLLIIGNHTNTVINTNNGNRTWMWICMEIDNVIHLKLQIGCCFQKAFARISTEKDNCKIPQFQRESTFWMSYSNIHYFVGSVGWRLGRPDGYLRYRCMAADHCGWTWCKVVNVVRKWFR